MSNEYEIVYFIAEYTLCSDGELLAEYVADEYTTSADIQEAKVFFNLDYAEAFLSCNFPNCDELSIIPARNYNLYRD